MSYFIQDSQGNILPEEYHHITHVRRYSIGDIVQATDGKGTVSSHRIQSLSPFISVVHKTTFISQPQPRISVIISLINPHIIDMIIPQLVELGVYKIYFTHTQHSQYGYSLFMKKRDKWNKLVIVGTKQSHNPYIPEINYLDIDYVLSSIDFPLFYGDTQLLLQPQPFFPSIVQDEEVYYFVGPEGGFSSQELSSLKQKERAYGLRLGDYILRTETACIVGLGLIRQLILSSNV